MGACVPTLLSGFPVFDAKLRKVMQNPDGRLLTAWLLLVERVTRMFTVLCVPSGVAGKKASSAVYIIIKH